MTAGDRHAGQELDAELLAAEVVEGLDDFLDHMSLAEGIGAKLNRQLLAFLKAEVLPQANQAAEMGWTRPRCSTPWSGCSGPTPRSWSGRHRPTATAPSPGPASCRAGRAPGRAASPRCATTPRACGRSRPRGS